MNNLYKVAKREYLQTIKKPSFWVSTFAFPVLMLGLAVLSGFSSAYAQKQGEEQAQNNRIVVLDEKQIIDSSVVPSSFQLINDKGQIDKELAGINDITDSNNYALVYIPSDFSSTKPVEIYMQSRGLFDSANMESVVKQILKASVIENVDNEKAKLVLTDQVAFSTKTINKDGESVGNNAGMLIVPIAAMAIYLLLVSFSTSYLLRSVSEEKENRMIEVVLTAVTPRQLVWGKVAGQIGIVVTQFLTLGLLTIIVLRIAKVQIPAEILSSIVITPQLLIFGILFLVLGFLTLAGLMVIAASAVPTYREAQAFSTAFILIGIIPFYLLTVILADPNGTLAVITSYLPLTSPLVMIMRLSVTEINFVEILFAAIINFVYLALSFVIAFKVFAWGALEYNRAISWKNLFGKV